MRQEKGAQTKLLDPDIFQWGGGLSRQGVGAKKFDMSLEAQGNKTFWQDMPEELEGKVSVLFLAPTKDGFCHHIGGDDLCVRVFRPLVGALVLGVFSMGVLLPNVGPA